MLAYHERMPRDAQATRDSILTAARAEFSAHGLAGARIDRIATRAGCNKERIYAGFGDKEQLYRQVIGDMLEELRLATVVHLDEDIGEYVRKSFDFHARNPALVRMLLWEALECTGGRLPDEEARRACYQRSTSALSEQMHDSADGDAARLLLTLLGLTAWPHAVPTLARLVTNDDTMTRTGQNRLREFLADFAERAMAGDRSRATSAPAERPGGSEVAATGSRH
jgi:AcrR family transcriptional regulator